MRKRACATTTIITASLSNSQARVYSRIASPFHTTTMDTATATKPTDAEAPFDRECPKADVVLRTSDNIDFHFPKLLLIFASPFFENLLSDGTPDELKDGRPIILVHDSSKDLRQLLYFCHPSLSPPPFSSIDDVVQVHAIAAKYCMEDALGSFQDIIMNSPEVMKSAPITLYGLAARYRLPALARSAAKLCLEIDAGKLMGSSDIEDQLKYVSALHINRLFAYHRACGTAIKITGIVYYCDGNNSVIHSCLEVFSKAMDMLLQYRPCLQTVIDAKEEMRTLERELLKCNACKPNIDPAVDNLFRYIANVIEDAVSKVCLLSLFLFLFR